MLSGDKVKPVLLNSKLPVDVLGRVSKLLLCLCVCVCVYGWLLFVHVDGSVDDETVCVCVCCRFGNSVILTEMECSTEMSLLW